MAADPAHLCPGYREHAPDTGRSRRACTELAPGEGGLRQPQSTGGEHSLHRLCTGGNGQRHQRELPPGTTLKTLPLPLHLIPEGEGHRHISDQPHRHLCTNGHKQLSPASGKGCNPGCQGMPQHAAQRPGCEQVRGCGSAHSRHAGQHHPGREPAALCKIQHQRQGVEDTGLGNRGSRRSCGLLHLPERDWQGREELCPIRGTLQHHPGIAGKDRFSNLARGCYMGGT